MAMRSGASAPTKAAPKPKTAFRISPRGPMSMHTGMPPTPMTIGNPASTSHRVCSCQQPHLMGQERCGGSGSANTPTKSLCRALTWTSRPMRLHPPPRHHRRHRCRRQRQLHRQLRPQARVGRFGNNAAGWAGQGQCVASQGASASHPTLTTPSASQAQNRLRRQRQRQHLHLHPHLRHQARHRPQHRTGRVLAATARYGEGASVSFPMEQASAARTSGEPILTYQLGAALGHQVDGAVESLARLGSISFQRTTVGRSPLTKPMRRELAHTVRSHTSSSATASHTATVGLAMTP